MNILFLIKTIQNIENSHIRSILTLCMFVCFSNLQAQCPVIAVSAGADQQHCENAVFILNGQAALSTQWGAWSVVSGVAKVADIYNPKSTATILLGQSATLRWSLTDNKTGCSGYDDVYLSNDGINCFVTCKNPINTNGNLESPGTITTYDLSVERTPAAFINTIKRPTGWSEGYGTNVNPNNLLGGFYLNHANLGFAHSGKRDIFLRGKDNCIASVQTNNPIICGTTYTMSAYIAPWTLGAAQTHAPFNVEFVFQDKEKVLPISVVEYELVAPKSESWNNLNWQRYEIKMTFTKSQYENFTLYFTSADNVTGILIDDVCVTSDVSGVIANAGIDKTQCGDGTFSLKSNVPSIGIGKWSIVSGVGTIQNEMSNVATVTGVPAGTTTTMRWSIDNGECGISTDDVVLINNATPSVSITPEGNEVCFGAASTITSFVAGGAAPFIYQWQSSTDGNNWTDIANQNAESFLVPTNTIGETFYRLSVSSSGNCARVYSASTKIKVDRFSGCECILQSCSNYSKLVFNNAQKIEDKPGLVGDKWRFSNVLAGFDAIVEVTNANNADSLRSIDNTAVNVDDWCPEIYVNFLNGKDSYVDWKVSIVQAGTNTPANLPSASRVTSYDVDGNSNYREIHGHINSNGYILNAPSELTVLNEPPFAMVLGSTNEYTSISTDPKVKATFYYPGQNNVFSIRLGVRTTNATGSAFRQFAVSFDPCISYAKPDINPQKPEIAGLIETCITNPQSIYKTTQPFNSYSWSVIGGTIVSGQGTREVKINWTTIGQGKVSVSTVDANGCLGTAEYNVNLVEQPTIVLALNNAIICRGESVSLDADVKGGIGTLTYIWSQSTDDRIYTSNSNSQNDVLNVSGLTQTTYYSLKIDGNANGCGIVEAKTSVKVVPPPTANAGKDQSQCSNLFAMDASLVVYGEGKWTVINGNVTFDDITSPTARVTLNSPTATLRWTISVNKTCEAFDDVVLTTTLPLSIVSNVSPLTECVGGTQTLSVTIAGGNGQERYQWQSSRDQTTWKDVTGARSSTFTPPSNVADTLFYRLMVTPAILDCSVLVSNAAKVQILPKPKVNVSANNQAVCNGGGVILSAKINGGVGCSIQWQNSSNGGTTWNDISGATNNTLTVTTMNQTTRYRTTIVCTGNGCCN
jgi:hypothetical protein